MGQKQNVFQEERDVPQFPLLSEVRWDERTPGFISPEGLGNCHGEGYMGLWT